MWIFCINGEIFWWKRIYSLFKTNKSIKLFIAKMCAIQLNKYETAPCFLLLNQNLMTDCLLIYVFLPLLTYFYLLRTWNWVFIFRTILGSQQVRMGKNTKINKQFVVIFQLNRRKYGSVSLAVPVYEKDFSKLAQCARNLAGQPGILVSVIHLDPVETKHSTRKLRCRTHQNGVNFTVVYPKTESKMNLNSFKTKK